MRRTFLQAKKFLQDEFPYQLEITGGNQPIEPMIQLVLNLLSVLQMLVLACAIFGEKVFLGRQPPALYYKLKQYGFGVVVAVFWILPSILNKWIITGAFEVTLDGSLIYSKLESGRMPTAGDLTGPLLKMGLTQRDATAASAS